jgi:hypothetical protein
MVYMRAERDRLLYAVLGGELPRGERADVRTEFNALFRLEKRLTLPADQAPDFEGEILSDSLSLVGRGREALVEQFKARLESADAGVFWLTGPGGIGKSFVMARLATELAGDPLCCRIAWRFKASDAARCNRFAFFRHALARLTAWPGLQGRDPGPLLDPNALEGQLHELLDAVAGLPADAATGRPPRVLFVLDGLDEIDRRDPSFAEVPFRLAGTRVLWVCSGRAERSLPQVFSPDRCTHLLDGGLLPMSDDDIRAMLLEGSDALKYQLLPLDVEEPGEGAVRVVNAAVEAVVRRAAGLPLYVHLVVEDVVNGHFKFAELPERLPAALEEYYDDLLRRMALGELHALLTPLLVTIAWGQAPLDEETLQLLMVRRQALVDGDECRDKLRKGLRALESMLRPAPLPGAGHGFEPYHFTFRTHICEDRAKIIGDQNTLARNAFCDLARDWSALPAGHSARRYLARHGLAHCRENGRPDDALRLAVRVADAGDWEYLAALVESMHQLRQADPGLVEQVLARLKTEGSHGAQLVRLLYNVWRMPTPVAHTTESYKQADRDFVRVSWIVDLFDRAVSFTGILAAADYLQQEAPAAPAMMERFSRLERPTLGQWAAFQRDYYRWLDQRNPDRPGEQQTLGPAFPELGRLLSSGRRFAHFERLQSELIGFRNRLAHRGIPTAQQSQQDLAWVLGKAGEYFEVLTALAEGELLVLQQQLGDGRGRFRLFAGPRPQADALVEERCPPAAEPGEVFFWTLGGLTPVSLFPFVLTDPADTTGIPLLLFHHARSHTWTYWHVGRKEALEIPAPAPVRFEACCREARATRHLGSPPVLPGDRPAARPPDRADAELLWEPTPPSPFPEKAPLLAALGEKWRAADAAGTGTESMYLARACCHAYVTYRLATLLGAYRAGGVRSAEVERELARLSTGPSPLGHRVLLLGLLGDHQDSLRGQGPQPDLGNHGAFRLHAEQWVRMVNEVIHSPMLDDAAYRAWARRLVWSLAAFTNQDATLAVPEVVGGEDGQLVQRWPSGVCLRLAPLLWRTACPDCGEEHVFFLIRIRTNNWRRKDAELTDIVIGHRLCCPDPVLELEASLGTPDGR